MFAGFPGELFVRVKHTVLSKRIITRITARAVNKATPVNIGQHSVWNLAGHNNGTIMKHEVQIFGPKMVEVNENLLPTGKLRAVKGTGYDFLSRHIVQNKAKGMKDAYAVNYVLGGKELKLASIVHEKNSGRILKFWTTAPTLHFCTSTKIKNVKGKGGAVYQPYSGFAFDGQEFPDAVNHKEFPSIILTKGKVFRRTNMYEFSVKP